MLLRNSELTVLVGPPGSGKTTLACALAAGVSNGDSNDLVKGLTVGIGNVLIVNREDGEATLAPRLLAAGADLNRVHFLDTLTVSEDHHPFDLIIFDPVYSAVQGDHSSNVKARDAYENLTRISKRLNCAILGTAYAVRNPYGKEPLARLAGPTALREVPRSVVLLNKIANGPTKSGGTHVFVHAKNSIGTMEGGFEYRVHAVEASDSSNGTHQSAVLEITKELFGPAEDILKNADGPQEN